MQILVKSIGIIIACFTAILIFSPAVARNIAAFMKQGNRLYFTVAARILIGILLIVASFSCTMREVVLTIGIITALAGAIPAALGIPKMLALIDWWMAKSDSVLRAMAVLSLILGVLLIYAA